MHALRRNTRRYRSHKSIIWDVEHDHGKKVWGFHKEMGRVVYEVFRAYGINREAAVRWTVEFMRCQSCVVYPGSQ